MCDDCNSPHLHPFFLPSLIVSPNDTRINHSPAATGANEVKEIRSATCQADPCRVPLGGQVDVEVDFVPTSDAKNVSIAVFASVFGFEVSLPLDDTDACSEGRLSCPIVTGKPHTLKYSLKVKDTYYPVSGDVGFRLVTESGEPLACATISAELYDKTHEEL